LGGDAFEILRASDATERLALLARHNDGWGCDMIREHDWPDAVSQIRDGAEDGAGDGDGDRDGIVMLTLGRVKDKELVLCLMPKPTFQARSFVSGLDTLIQMAIAQEQHRRERLRSGSVWRHEERLHESRGLFGGQHMSDVFAQAMKVA
jgi:hypothetical protein